MKKLNLTVLLNTLFLQRLSAVLSSFKRQESATDDWARMVNGRYMMINNVWNKGTISGYSQEIFFRKKRGTPIYGWKWKWPDSRVVVAFPEIFYGISIWDDTCRLQTEFPFRAGSREINVKYRIKTEAKGSYNTVFEVWANKTNPPSKDGISHEIMFWVDIQGNDISPDGFLKETITIDGYETDVYINPQQADISGENTNQWKYIAFRFRPSRLSGTLNIHKYIDYLIDIGELGTEDYLTSVELGNEIAWGRGVTKVVDYSVTTCQR